MGGKTSLLSAHQSKNKYLKHINCKTSTPKFHPVSKWANELDRQKEIRQIANRYLKKNTQNLAIEETGDFFPPQSEWLLSRKYVTVNASADREKEENIHTVGGKA